MNGFLWLCERNGHRTTLTSPVKGLKDIEHNQALDATYLNPPPHPHIPEPPRGVRMPEKNMKEADMKWMMLAATHGSACPMRMEIDTHILGRFERPPGALPSSLLGFEAVTVCLYDFGVEDYLNGSLYLNGYVASNINDMSIEDLIPK